jgi:SAM-dependent methyltransferase
MFNFLTPTMKNHFETDMNDIQIRALLGLKQELQEGALTFFYQVCPCGEKAENFKVANQDRYGLEVGYVCCKNCGLMRLYPNLNETSWKKFYAVNYPLLKNSVDKNSKNNFEDLFAKEVKEGKRIFKSPHINCEGITNTIRPKLLDIGCGFGGMVQLAGEHGYDGYGCDYDPDAVNFAASKRLDIRLGGIEQFSADRGYFDVIILSHVLEHVSEPASFLKSAADLLKPGGYIYIELPGYRDVSFSRYRGKLLRYLRIFHPFNFDLKALTILAGRSGLEIKEGNEWIQAWFRKTNNVSGFSPILQKRNGLQLYFFMLKFKPAVYPAWQLLSNIKRHLSKGLNVFLRN